MENFEELSNEQLRLKLLEYGMANMPVTQTTRKVLIKKLKNHLENANVKVRRETIHVAKYSSDEDTDTGAGSGGEAAKKTQKKETSRRATIGGSAAKLSKTLPVMPNLPPPKPAAVVEKVDPAQKRRSGRITPVQTKEDAPTANAPKEPMIVENSDEDEDMIPLTQPVSRRYDRKSKSPSLSRAEMVTTSYIHEVEVSSKPGGIVEEMEIDLTESTDDVIIESSPVPVPEPAPVKIRPPTTPSRETRHSSNITTTTTKRTTIGGAPSAGIYTKDPYAGRPSLSTTATSYTSSYNPPAPREPQTSSSSHRQEPSGGIDSPYLSEFTKRLSRLKAESAQLNAAREHPIRRTIAGSSYAASPRVGGGGEGEYVSSRYSAVGGRQQLRTMDNNGGGKGEIRSSLRQVIVALDQKYSFKKMFYVLIIMLIVIFLFVFFFL